MTDFSDQNLSEIDFHQLFEERRRVAVIWSVEDVQEIRPDLTDDQAWEVLQRCLKWHDCNDGFNWGYLEAMAKTLFPEPENALFQNEEGE